MNVKNENRLNMYLVVADYLNTVPAETLQSMPNFEQIFAEFNSNVQLLRSTSENQRLNRLGYQMEKASGKMQTVTYALNMANCITAYAVSINDEVLIQSMKFTKSKLFLQRDTKTAEDAQLILKKAEELTPQLDPYGIKQDNIDYLRQVLANFNAKIPQPRANINIRKLLTKEIDVLITKIEDLLFRMDKLVKIKQLTDLRFYESYNFSRKIVNNHGSKLAIRGFVTDTNGNPISSVNVSIPNIERETVTTEKGYFEFKNLPKGLQNLIFSRVDYTTTNQQVGIIKGQRVQLNVTLKAATNQQDVA